jgi:hypothetical protein
MHPSTPAPPELVAYVPLQTRTSAASNVARSIGWSVSALDDEQATTSEKSSGRRIDER